MNKRKLATLVAASFAGLMLSSPSFATDADKAQTTASASRAAESRSIERADKKATGPKESHRTGTSKPSKPEGSATERAQDNAVASANAKTDAEAEYKAAVEKCESQPSGQRSACVQDAEKAQTLAMQQSQDGTSSSGAPQESHRTGSSKPRNPEASATDRAQDKAVVSANAKTEAQAEYKAAVEKCESQPSGQRSACVQDAEKAQTLAMQQSQDGTSSSGAPQESHRTGTSKPSKPDASDKRATERAEDKVVASANAKTDPEAEYKAAVEKCESQPSGQRSACVQDAEKAQTLTMQQRTDGTSSSEAPKSRSGERADDKAAKSDASRNTAMKNQTDSNTSRNTGAPASRVPGQQSAK